VHQTGKEHDAVLVSADFLPNLEKYGAWFDNNSLVDFTELALFLRKHMLRIFLLVFICSQVA
jgi:hypothetical protein